MNISWGLGLLLFFVYLIFGKISLILGLLLNGFITTFTRYHILGIMLSLTIMAFGFFELLWIKLMFLGITIIKNYDVLISGYGLAKRMLKNVVQMTNVEKSLSDLEQFLANELPMENRPVIVTKKDDLQIFVSIKNKIDWIESKYNCMQNTYDEFKTKINKYCFPFRQSILCTDLATLYNNFNEYTNIVFASGLVNGKYVGELLMQVQFVNYIKSYYDSGNKLYNMCITPEDDLFIKPNLALLDETNNLKDSNLGQTLLVDTIGNIFIDDKYSKASDLEIVDLPETKKKNKNTKKKNPNPEELMNEMSKMLDMMENLGNMANMSNLGNMKLPPITNPQFGNFPAFDISHAFNEHLLSDNPFTILSSMRPQQKQKVAQVDKVKPKKIIENPSHVTSNEEPVQVTSEESLQVQSNEELLPVQSNEEPLQVQSNEGSLQVTSEKLLQVTSNEEPLQVQSNEGSLQVPSNEKSLGDVANEELTREQLNSFDNIMSELSAIAEKAENISNSKIMLKKKTGKHKKKKSINNK